MSIGISVRSLTKWIKQIGIFGIRQLFVQGLMFASGVIVLRSLSKPDFASFIFTQTVFSVMSSIADSGLIAATIAEGGRVWPDGQKLGGVVKAAIQVRSRILPVLALLGGIMITCCLRRFGIPVYMSAGIAVIVIVTFVLTAIGNVYGAVVRLAGRAFRIQQLEFAYYVQRCIYTLAFFSIFQGTLTAVIANLFAVLYSVWQPITWSREFYDERVAPSAEARRRIYSMMKQMLPATIYSSFSPQIAILLMSAIGNASGVADLGALSRLGQIMAILGSINSSLFIPMLAREKSPSIVRSKLIGVVAFSSICCGAVLGLAAIFPKGFLFILGPNYYGLPVFVLMLSLFAVALSTISGIIGGLANNRGYVIPPVAYITVNVGAQIALLLLLPVHTLTGVLIYNAGIAIIGLLLNCGLVWRTMFSKDENITST